MNGAPNPVQLLSIVRSRPAEPIVGFAGTLNPNRRAAPNRLLTSASPLICQRRPSIVPVPVMVSGLDPPRATVKGSTVSVFTELEARFVLLFSSRDRKSVV